MSQLDKILQRVDAFMNNGGAGPGFGQVWSNTVNLIGLTATPPTTVGGPMTLAASVIADQGIIVKPPLAASWTPRNFSTGTTFVDSGRPWYPTVYLQDLTTGTAVVRGADQPIPSSPPYRVICRFRLQPINNAGVGMYLTDGTKVIAYMFDSQSGVGQQQVFTSTTFSSGTSLVAGPTPADIAINSSVYYSIYHDGTTRHYQLSVNGQNFIEYFTHASGTFLAETAIGVFGYGTSGTGYAMSVESWNPDPNY